MDNRGGKVNNRAGVLICGAYGMGNAGDEAILDAIIAQMRAIDPSMPITVLSRSPEDTAKKHGVESIYTFDIRAFLKKMRSVKLYINGGGSLIQDVTSSRSIWYYLYTLMAAKHRGCRVLMYGCGIGPVEKGYNKKLSARILNRFVDAITLREPHSLRELESMGVKNPEIIVASDPALSLAAADKEQVDALWSQLGLERERDYICFCLRAWPGYKEKAPLFGAAADYAAEKYGLQPVFLSVNHIKDGEASRLAIEAMNTPASNIHEPLSTALVVGLLGRMRAVVSMRLHALIFASGVSVPLAGVSYDPKVSAFMDYIGLENYADFESLTAEGLCLLIDRAMEMDREQLRENTEKIKAIEYKNLETAKKLLDFA